MTCTYIFYHSAYRVRGWGRLPHRRGPTLLVANHQQEMETTTLVSTLSLESLSWRYPIFAVAGRRMFEPGFLVQDFPWLSLALYRFDQAWLFAAIGLQPVENALHTRSFNSLAHSIVNRHGDLPLSSVFREEAIARLPGPKMLSDVFGSRYIKQARANASLSELREPYRSEELAATRTQLDADIENFADLARDGATIFLTPEAFFSGDGRMRRMRGLLAALAPLTNIWLLCISYDPFVGRRLSMLYRVLPSSGPQPIETQIKANRTVTTSALLGTWLNAKSTQFTPGDALEAVRTALTALPTSLFVDPDLRRAPERMVRSALVGMLRLGMLRKDGESLTLTERRAHPEFPRTLDMIEYQSNFHAETLEGARTMENARPPENAVPRS